MNNQIKIFVFVIALAVTSGVATAVEVDVATINEIEYKAETAKNQTDEAKGRIQKLEALVNELLFWKQDAFDNACDDGDVLTAIGDGSVACVPAPILLNETLVLHPGYFEESIQFTCPSDRRAAAISFSLPQRIDFFNVDEYFRWINGPDAGFVIEGTVSQLSSPLVIEVSVTCV